ncbi:NAD-dependent epimerase/dehydratase family protein [Paenibacillus sacheonensis]|uniref:NAD-dependent epimerase/dehydratase family protein n=1 Tax=Paenibacillus sacheonensis TaxID=742054 RepID=A0A7X5BZ71_9BACL|nr:NAD(P)-dependent oxidoreductase [Paenibacillus sacheonensis]MBM7568555.1 nucleoside-diphosphate-sugar epimerase [Paenibacillus sacheonensis]NBC72378.1 NAD-dependent epimerase/dehydratase family protein [Paenibacillus sacheonensis]
MQTIAVTGGAGKLGKYVVQELIRQNYRVISLDQKRAADLRCKQIIVDMNDLGQVASALQDVDAVIHLAAIPSPTGFPIPLIFANNVMGSYNVLEAASMLRMKRVVMGSSTSCYGFAWAAKPFSPQYLPIDEAHPQLSQEGYGFSKTVGELTAEMFHRRNGLNVVNLRFSLIAAPEEYEHMRKSIDNPVDGAKILWSYIDIRDAAKACVASLHPKTDGAIALNITGDDTFSSVDTLELLRECCPDVTDLRSEFAGREPLFSNRLAKETLDWQPEHCWSDALS